MKTINYSIKILLVGVSILGLAACSSANRQKDFSPAAVTMGGHSNGTRGAYCSGLGNQQSFNGKSNKGTFFAPQSATYYFDFDRSEVHSVDLTNIKNQANYLTAHPRARVLLEGNTDSRGSREYNIALGQRRANAVAEILVLDGVAKRQIATVSYGEEKPIAHGHSEAAYAKNRRVHLVYTNNGK